jgi:hypothetical protein
MGVAAMYSNARFPTQFRSCVRRKGSTRTFLSANGRCAENADQ